MPMPAPTPAAAPPSPSVGSLALATLRSNALIPLVLLALWPLAWFVESSGKVDPYWARIGILIGINITLAVSLQLINGVSGQFSLGHAGFMAVGAYLAGYPAKAYARSFLDPASTLLFYVALAIVVVIVGAVLYGLLRAAAMLRKVHRSLP